MELVDDPQPLDGFPHALVVALPKAIPTQPALKHWLVGAKLLQIETPL